LLGGRLGLPPLLLGLPRIGVELVAPATVLYSGRGEIIFGEPDGSESPRTRRLADAFTAAGVPHQLRRDVLVSAWEKLAWNAGFNAVSTLADATVREGLALPRVAGLGGAGEGGGRRRRAGEGHLGPPLAASRRPRRQPLGPARLPHLDAPGPPPRPETRARRAERRRRARGRAEWSSGA